MKKITLILFATLLCCGFESCNKDFESWNNGNEHKNNGDYPKEMEFMDFSLKGTSCDWKMEKLLPNTIYVINSEEELLAHISCGGDDIPSIDFKKNSLIRVFGTTTSGIHNITKSLQQISDNKYQLSVDITLNYITVAESWNISFLTSKVSKQASFTLITNGNEYEPDPTKLIQIAQGELYGSGSEGIPKQDVVITTKVEWDRLKQAMDSRNDVTNSFLEKEIDFSKYQIIAVFEEVKTSGGWSIDITEIKEDGDDIIVRICNLKKGDATLVITQPFHIVKIPVSAKKIVFEHYESNNEEKPDVIKYRLTGTKWKLSAFVDVENNTQKTPEPENCEPCYTLSFETNSILLSHSSTNELRGEYTAKNMSSEIQIIGLGGTKINELFDGNLYVESLQSVQSFSIKEDELKLYYNEGKNYLLFKSLLP